jgi:DNA-binding MarR family transcriptional regulator
MISLQQRLLDYLEPLTGERPDLAPEKATNLPLFLRERFDFQNVRLFGQRYILALEKENGDSESPGEYENQIRLMQPQFTESVALVLQRLPSYARNRMVRLGIPFIVPGSQTFLPAALIDLRERFTQPKPDKGKKLTPAAQCLVLYHLQRQPLENLPLRDIAEKIGYSPIMLTKVKDELEATGICNTARMGRSIALEFTTQGRNLWETVQPILSSPVKKTLWVRWDQPGYPALIAGLTALSRKTIMADDRLPTYALLSATFQKNLEQGLYHGCREPEDANLRLESWSYNPLLFCDDGMVDPLSLFLSLLDFPDERVQQQLETLIDRMPW